MSFLGDIFKPIGKLFTDLFKGIFSVPDAPTLPTIEIPKPEIIAPLPELKAPARPDGARKTAADGTSRFQKSTGVSIYDLLGLAVPKSGLGLGMPGGNK